MRELADQPIPEEYFTGHADSLFDLLAGTLVKFERRLNRCSPARAVHFRAGACTAVC
jgi:hypothetical protein